MRSPFAAAVAAALLATAADAQLTPTRTYYGVNRPLTIDVQIPEGAAGEAEIYLLMPVTGDSVAQAPVQAGSVDLSTLFPILWNHTGPTLKYAQLIVGGTKIGPALVLQPMLTPPAARLTDPRTGMPYFVHPATGQPNFLPQNGKVTFDPPTGQLTYSGLRVYSDAHVILDTTQGEIEIRMRPDMAPNTVWNFRELAEGGYYDGVIFHRIVNKPGQRFVIQGGDPTGTGTGGPGYTIDLERSLLPHDYGVLSMARSSDPNSAGSQFFICLGREATQALDQKYTGFAEVVRGMSAVNAIASYPVDAADKPTGDTPPTILAARLVPAPPHGDGPLPEKPEAASEAQPR